MFKYIGYNLRTDTLTATNDKSEWALTCGHIPQICEYFSSIEEYLKWQKKNPTAHEDFLEEERKFFEKYERDCEEAMHWEGLI